MYDPIYEDDQADASTNRYKNAITSFGASQRLKMDRPNWVGPGR
jgi:hypothetical protein